MSAKQRAPTRNTKVLLSLRDKLPGRLHGRLPLSLSLHLSLSLCLSENWEVCFDRPFLFEVLK